MFKRIFLALVLCLITLPAAAQNVTCATRPPGDSSNACASTAFVFNAINVPSGLLSANNLWTGSNAWTLPTTVGTGAFAPLPPTNNTPNLTGASLFAPAANDNTNIPALAVIRTTQGGNPSNQSNETLFVGTHLNLTSPSSFYWGFNNQVQVDHNAATAGNNAYAEAMRSDCEIASTIDQPFTCWGATFLSRSNSPTIGTFNIGVEAVVATAVGDAPIPPAFVSNFFSVGVLVGAGGFAPQNHLVDAGFMVNNSLPAATGGGFQAGFECPKETGAGPPTIHYACIYGASTSQYGLNLVDGHWSVASINAPGLFVDPVGNLFAKTLNGIGNTPTFGSCGTSPAITAGSNSNGGAFTLGTGAPTACTVLFDVTARFSNNAFCTVTPATDPGAGLRYWVSTSVSTGFTVTLSAGTSSVVFNYTCIGD
jgi:hypothetical protein